MPQTIFFSWQADTPTKEGRNFIERALQRALDRIGADTTIEKALRDLAVDRDTKGVAGTPPIVETIFSKIDSAAVFLPDLTFVGQRRDSRPTPNPNVLIEYGWALKSRGHGCMVPVMNTAFGHPTPDNIPFDMRHLKNPIQYHCADDASEEERRTARDALSKDLEGAIRAIMSSASLNAKSDAIAAPEFEGRAPQNGLARFRKLGDPLGLNASLLRTSRPVVFEEGPAFWLRVMPKFKESQKFSINALKEAAQKHPYVRPLNREWSDLGNLRSNDGFGVYASGDEETTESFVFIFQTGEIWSADRFRAAVQIRDGRRCIALEENHFVESLIDYTHLLQGMGLGSSFKWIAGIEGIIGLPMILPDRPGYRWPGGGIRGQALGDALVEQGDFDTSSSAPKALRPFFEALYEHCALDRPSWLDEDAATASK